MAETRCDECLVHRVGSYPLVAALTQQALQGYSASKEYSPMLKATLNLSEAWAKYALNTAYPLYVKFEGPLDKASAMAVSSLPYLEEKVPALKMTPGELATAGRERYFKGSLLERTLNTALAAPSVAGEKGKLLKAEAAKEMAALVASQGKDQATRLLRTGLLALNAALDAADRALDAQTTDAGVLGRIGTLGARAGDQIRSRAASGINFGKSVMAWETEQAVALITYVRGLGGRLGSVDLASLRQAAITALKDLEAKAQVLKVKPEALLLSWIKGTSGIAATLTHKSLSLLPKAQAGLTSFDDYIANLDANLKEADTLGAVGQEMWKEAKETKDAVEGKIVVALESLTDTPPLSWMTAPSSPVHPAESDTPTSTNPTHLAPF